MHPARSGSSVVLLNLNVAVHGLDALRLARNGHSLGDFFLACGAAGLPHDAVCVRINMNTPQAGDMFSG
jgi:hypothetical protein